MKLNRLALKDKKLFEGYLRASEYQLSAYAFANIYIWNTLYDISWCIIKDRLCVFFKDRVGCFLYLPPLGGKIDTGVCAGVFKIMDSVNRNREISRIENIEDRDLVAYRELGYECYYKSSDYVCSRFDLASLRGDKFKSKRASVNYFLKHYEDIEYVPFSLKYKDACLELFGLWKRQRAGRAEDTVYQGMIDDSRLCLSLLLEHYTQLDITGRLIKIGGRIKGLSFGLALNKDTFCIVYEITDLSIKGLAQSIFREFCSELKDFRYINIMDDSGLDNLKKVKLSYHPVKLIPAYIAVKSR